jgi:site-specific DNA recombinase
LLGLYIRVSTEQQSEKYSLDAQKENGVAFASMKEYEYRLYSESLSGGEFMRPAFQSMLDDIKSGLVDVVWVKEISRLSRDISDFQTIKKIFITHKVMLYVDGSQIDLNNIDQGFFYNLSSVISAYEKERIRERTNRGRRASIDKGEYKYPHIVGYKRLYDEQGRSYLVIDEPESRYITEVYDLYLSLKSVTKVAQKIGKAKSSIIKILRNPIYTGRHYNTDGCLIRFIEYQQFITTTIWSEVQAILDDRYKTNIVNKGGKYYDQVY